MSTGGADNTGDRRSNRTPGPARARGTAPGGGVVDRRVIPDRRELLRQQREQAGQAEGQYAGKTSDNSGAAGAAAVTGVTGLERRRGPGRRLSDFTRAAEEGELTREQFLFLMAIEEFKRANARGFPSWTDVLEVIRLLGYRKTMASELNLRSAEDWREQPDTPANVRPKGWESRPGGKRDAA